MSQSSQTLSSAAERITQLLAKASPAERPHLLREFKRQVYRDSLFCYAKYALGYSELNHHAHGKMIAALEADTRRKLIVMPRGTFKTSVTSVAYPMWQLERNANLRVLLDSELYTNSKNILREIKAHYESPSYTEIFGERRGGLWNEGEILISSRSIVKKEASITCGGIGTQKTGQHYDLIVADDLNSPKNSNTPEGCDKVIQHFRLYTSLLEPDGTIALVGTRYSQNDAIAFVLKNELGIDESTFGNQTL